MADSSAGGTSTRGRKTKRGASRARRARRSSRTNSDIVPSDEETSSIEPVSQPTIQEETSMILSGSASTPTLDFTPGQIIVSRGTELQIEHLEEFKAYLDTLPDREQYDNLTGLAEHVNKTIHVAHHVSEVLEQLAESKGLLNQFSHEDSKTWGSIREQAKKAKDERDRKQGSYLKLKEHWSKGELKELVFLQGEGVGNTTYRTALRLSTTIKKKNLPFTAMKMAILQGQLERFSKPGKGVSTALKVQNVDIGSAVNIINDNRLMTKDELQQALILAAKGVTDMGFICGIQDNQGLMIAYGADTAEEVAEGSEAGTAHDTAHDLPSTSFRKSGGMRNQPTTEDDDNDQLDVDIDEAASQADKAVKAGGIAFTAIDEDEFVPTTNDDEEASGQEDGSDDDQPLAKRMRDDKGKAVVKSSDKAKCGCALAVPKSFTRQLRKGMSFNEIAQSALITSWHRHRVHGMCYRHEQLLASAVGLKTKELSHAGLQERLEVVRVAIEQSTLGQLKVSDNYVWFRASKRPARPADDLGPYKFLPRDIKYGQLSTSQQVNMRAYLGVNEDNWHNDGSINIACFEWWDTITYDGPLTEYQGQTIMSFGLEEFDMYDHHLRHISGKSNFSWLRSMFHSIMQQLMRQDPRYWMLYASLREDGNSNLVSYPYYAKYQKAGDLTFFRHIDINVPNLAEANRGRYQIQGTVSLDEEFKDDCTHILPGMHHHLEEWYEDLKGRENVSLDGLVHAITNNMWTKEDAKKHSTDWTSVPCKKLQVRITQPHLPHGAWGPAVRVRRTMLPWFVALQDDHFHLEVIESGTWEDLSKAHRDLNSGPRTPSGLANRYGDIPFAFPAAAPVMGLGALSDALVCRVRHDNPATIAQKRLLIEGTNVERDTFITSWRKEAVRVAFHVWDVVKRSEREVYGDKSYFLCKETGTLTTVAGYDPTPDVRSSFRSGGHGVEYQQVDARDAATDQDHGEEIEIEAVLRDQSAFASSSNAPSVLDQPATHSGDISID